MKRRPSLRRRLIVGLLAYIAILSAVFATHGYWVNERTEQAVWESLLRSEMEFFTTRRAQDPARRGLAAVQHAHSMAGRAAGIWPRSGPVATGWPSRIQKSRPPSISLTWKPSRASLYAPLVEPLQPMPSQ